ncbi:MAG: PQQ-binding-like beta-propeller repeat protein, partial [Planctomycetota bacterium]
RDGILPSQWTASDYAWNVPLDAADVGSPTIAWVAEASNDHNAASQDRPHMRGRPVVYLTASKPKASVIELLAIDLQTGNVRWRNQFPLSPRRLHARNSPASSTPAADDQRVYVTHADASGLTVRAFTHGGELEWTRRLGDWTGYHGFGASPVVMDDRVLVFNSQQTERLESDQTPGDSSMIALDAATGQTVWQTPLTTTRVCYGVPAVLPEMIIGANTGNGLFGLDRASGEMMWSIDVFDLRCCSSPVITALSNGDRLAIATCGSGGGRNTLSAVRVPANRNDQPTEVFRIESNAPYVPTPCVTKGLIFTIADRGIASCFDLDGKRLWIQRLGGGFGASPIVIGDRLLMISLDGRATIMAASGRKQILGEIDLGGTVGATPAVADDRMVLRIADRLVCLPLDS